MPKHLVYGLDIETGYAAVKAVDASTDGARANNVVVDPQRAPITRIALSTAAAEFAFEGDESELLSTLDDHLAHLEPGILATWNGSGFDLPYIADRAGIAGIRLGLRLAADPRLRLRGDLLCGHHHAYRAAWFGHRHLDVARLYRSGRRPLIAVDELFRAVTGSVRDRTARRIGYADTPKAALTHDAAHAFAANDARLVRSLVEARLPGVWRHADRVTIHPVTTAQPEAVHAASALTTRGGRIPMSAAHPAVRAALAASNN